MKRLLVLGATGSIGTTCLNAFRSSLMGDTVIAGLIAFNDSAIYALGTEFSVPVFLSENKTEEDIRAFISSVSPDIALNGVSGIAGLRYSDLLIDMGIDIVIHSASKYFGGNSDLVGGVIMGSDEDITHIFNTEFMPLGPVPDPMQAWLILRNLRNLEVRMPVHYRNALGLAQFLESRPEVEEVLYPLLPSFPQYDLAKKQLRGGSGLFSFRLKTRNLDDVKKFTDSVKYFKRAVSWGGYESLIDPNATAFRPGTPIPDDRISLIRVHAGIESLDMLKDDLASALDAIGC